jgi:hypothetical protein
MTASSSAISPSFPERQRRRIRKATNHRSDAMRASSVLCLLTAALLSLSCSSEHGEVPQPKQKLATVTVAGVQTKTCNLGLDCPSGYCIDVSGLSTASATAVSRACSTVCSQDSDCHADWICRHETSPGGVEESYCVPLLHVN